MGLVERRLGDMAWELANAMSRVLVGAHAKRFGSLHTQQVAHPLEHGSHLGVRGKLAANVSEGSTFQFPRLCSLSFQHTTTRPPAQRGDGRSLRTKRFGISTWRGMAFATPLLGLVQSE